MKKVTPYIAGIVILILVLIVINPNYFQVLSSYIFNSRSTQEPVVAEPTEVQKNVPVIKFKTVTDTDKAGKWKFSATYPIFDDTLSKKFSAINSQIEAEVQVIKLQNTDSLSSDISPENVPPALSPFEITVTGEATTSEEFGTVSVLYSTFVDGGLLAHPYTNFESHTFNLNDGTEKGLGDIFSEKDLMERLSKSSVSKLKEYYSAMGNSDTSFLDGNDGLTATSTNFNVFMLSDENLILQFEEYQLGSRPYGAPRIEIPFSGLTEN